MTNRLKEIRESKGLTLEDVGKGVGLATNTISRYETPLFVNDIIIISPIWEYFA